MKHTRNAAVVAAVSAVLLGLSAGPAFAGGLVEMDHFDDLNEDTWDANDPEFCDGLVPFAVHWEEHAVGTFRLVERKGQEYGSVNGSFVGTYTNLETDLGYHYSQRLSSGDQEIIPAGDGDLTITFTDRFNVFWTDDLGRADFHDAGANTVTIVVDENGDFVSFVDNRARGRSDTEGRDFCDDLIEFTTP